MELWQKVLAAKNKAEADFPHPGEQREMEVFLSMLDAALHDDDDGEDEAEQPAKPSAPVAPLPEADEE